MSDTSKKLTVAFGTFSCTLQGFDDPFPIMKRVVDYFQSLAAADPTFGSEPQRPDTDELRTIAEENTDGGVEAELLGDELVLRQTETPEAPVEAAVEPAPVIDVVEADPIVEEPEAKVADIIETPEPDQVWQAAQNWTAPEPVPVSADVIAQNEEAAAVDAALAVHNADMVAELAASNAGVEATPVEDTPEPLDLSAFMPEEFVAEDSFAPEMAEDAQMEEAFAETPAEDYYEDVAEDVADTEFDASDASGDFDVVEDDAAQADTDPANWDEWAAEFASDVDAQVSEQAFEPEETIEDTPAAMNDFPSEEEVEVEDAALARILAALRSRQSAEEAPAVRLPLKTENVALPEASGPQPLRLGFGETAGLDATHHADTETVDHQKAAETNAFDAMLGTVAHDEADFDYAPDPLLLTPAQKVEDLPQEPQASDLRNFAKTMGAASVTDLIEASAAYVTLVDGRPNFSRREVLGLLDELTDDQPLTQETRIKSFGTLLRGGRFKRAENGEFALADAALTEYETRKSA